MVKMSELVSASIIESTTYETLNQVQGDKKAITTQPHSEGEAPPAETTEK